MSHSNRKLFTTNQLDDLEAHAFNIIQARNWVNVMIQEYQQSLGNVLNTVSGSDQKDSSIQVQNLHKEDPSTANNAVLPSEVFNIPKDLLSTVNDAPLSNQILNPSNEFLSTVNDTVLSSEVFNRPDKLLSTVNDAVLPCEVYNRPNKLFSTVNDARLSNQIFNPPSSFLSTIKDAALNCKVFKPPNELFSTVNDALLSNQFVNPLGKFLSTVNDAAFTCEAFNAPNKFLSTVNNAALSSENMAVDMTSASKIGYPNRKEIEKPKICSSKKLTIEPLRQSSDIHIYVPIDYSIAKPKEQNNSINCTIGPYKNLALSFCNQHGGSSLGSQQREKKFSNFNENINLYNKEAVVKPNLFASAGPINGLENSWEVLAYSNIFRESKVQDYKDDTESDSSEEDQYYSRIVERSRKRRKRRNKKNGAKRRR